MPRAAGEPKVKVALPKNVKVGDWVPLIVMVRFATRTKGDLSTMQQYARVLFPARDDEGEQATQLDATSAVHASGAYLSLWMPVTAAAMHDDGGSEEGAGWCTSLEPSSMSLFACDAEYAAALSSVAGPVTRARSGASQGSESAAAIARSGAGEAEPSGDEEMDGASGDTGDEAAPAGSRKCPRCTKCVEARLTEGKWVYQTHWPPGIVARRGTRRSDWGDPCEAAGDDAAVGGGDEEGAAAEGSQAGLSAAGAQPPVRAPRTDPQGALTDVALASEHIDHDTISIATFAATGRRLFSDMAAALKKKTVGGLDKAAYI